METPWFYLPALSTTGAVALDEPAAKHVQVLRMREGDALVLTNGAGLIGNATIQTLGKKQCMVNVLALQQQPRQVHRKVGMAISPLKNTARLEWFLEKATELGVAEIFPISCHRTVREHFRYERLNSICISAMLQSQQAWLPALHQPLTYEALMQQVAASEVDYHSKWIAHCADFEKHHLAHAVKPGMTDSLLLIGPEGDFTEAEIVQAIQQNFAAVSLGDTRLRTETAGVVGASLLCLLP